MQIVGLEKFSEKIKQFLDIDYQTIFIKKYKKKIIKKRIYHSMMRKHRARYITQELLKIDNINYTYHEVVFCKSTPIIH